jgi:serine/threonine protein kinase
MLSDDDNIKIIDFGFSKYFEIENMMKTICGSPIYMSPELFNNTKYNYKTDYWSMGLIIYQIIVGDLPFNAKSIPELTKKLSKLECIKIPLIFAKDYDNNMIKLIEHMLILNPTNRITFEELINNIYIQNINNPDISDNSNPDNSNNSNPDNFNSIDNNISSDIYNDIDIDDDSDIQSYMENIIDSCDDSDNESKTSSNDNIKQKSTKPIDIKPTKPIDIKPTNNNQITKPIDIKPTKPIDIKPINNNQFSSYINDNVKTKMLDSVNIINKVEIKNNYFSMPTSNYTDNYIKSTYERKNTNFINDSLKSLKSLQFNFNKIIRTIGDTINGDVIK